MPKVPVLEQSRVERRPAGSVGYSGFQNPRRGNIAGDGSEAIGQGLQQVAQGVDKVGIAVERAREEADNYRVEEALLKEAADTDELLSGKDGFLHRKGRNAMDPSTVYETLEKKRSDIYGGLHNDRQRRLYRKQSEKSYLQTRHLVENHSSKESGNYFSDMSKAQVSQSLVKVQQFATVPGNEYNIEAQIENVAHVRDPGDPDDKDGALVLFMRHQLGAPPAAVEYAVNTYRAQAYASVIESRLNNDPPDVKGAMEYYSAKKGQLGEHDARISRAVKIAGAAVEVDTYRQEVAMTTPLLDPEGNKTQWLDETAARKKASDIPSTDPYKTDKVKAIEDLINKAQEDKKNAAKSKFGEALSLVNNEKVPLSSPRMATIKAYLTNPVNGIDANNYWDTLEARVRADKRANQTSNTEARRAQQLTDEHMLNMFRLMPIGDQMRTDIDTWLADSQVEVSQRGRDLIALQRKSAGDRVNKGGEVTDSAFRKVMGDQLDAIPQYKNRKSQARQEVEAKLIEWHTGQTDKNGDPRIPSKDEVSKFIAGEMLQVETTKKPVSFIPFTYTSTDRAINVPKEERGKYRPAPLKKQDAPVVKETFKVSVIDESGKHGTIPNNQLEAWLKGDNRRRKK